MERNFFLVLFKKSILAYSGLLPIILRLSHTEHGWTHGSNTEYSVIHGLTGTSIELQPCLGVSWYDLDSNVARVCTNKARIYSVKQGLSRLEHDLQNDFHTIVVGFQVRYSTVCYGLVGLNTTFTRLTGHLQGLHTVPPILLELSHIHVCFEKLTRFDGLAS